MYYPPVGIPQHSGQQTQGYTPPPPVSFPVQGQSVPTSHAQLPAQPDQASQQHPQQQGIADATYKLS